MKKIIFWAVLLLGLALPVFAQEEEQPGYKIALQRIEQVRISGTTILSLWGLGLTELPPEIWEELPDLQYLNLYNNQLTSLPSEIAKLERLCFLDLRRNYIESLPSEMGALRRLEDRTDCEEGARGLIFADPYTPLVSEIGVQYNPLTSLPSQVVEQGTPAILAYLRNEAWWHLQRLIAGAAGSVGLLAAIVLGWRWKNRRGRKEKEKRG